MSQHEEVVKYPYASDDAHGWLKVPVDDVKAMGETAKEISHYSFVRKHYIYLEEDRDAEIFLNWLDGQGIIFDVRKHIRAPHDMRDSHRFNFDELMGGKYDE